MYRQSAQGSGSASRSSGRTIFQTQGQHRGVRTQRKFCVQAEADIHGIAFGQRIIDGKVRGMSMMDLKPEESRTTPFGT
jgi:hypothetical protein